MSLGTISEEASECRKAFEGVEVGAFVWCCHHEALIEFLSEPADNRIAYILESKDYGEQARRLHEFRPVKGKIPSELDKARAEWYKAIAECITELTALHLFEVPDTTWNGKSIL